MKTVYLIRHAKSDWGDPTLRDFDRPLNKRGNRDAPEMGRRLKSRNEIPDILVSSTAKRAAKTARKIAEQVNFEKNQILWEDDLYHASPETIINVINSLPDSAKSVFVFGHNPGMSYAAYSLSGLPVEMVTCSICKIEFEVDTWEAVFPDSGHLVYHDYPKKEQ